MVAYSEGTIDVEDGYRVWYRKVGSGQNTPLLILHGGPGAGHDYLESLEALADERPVIFYDQLGCGRSDQPDEPSRWHIDRFVREIDLVRRALDLHRIHLRGRSWGGGWLAIEYMLGAAYRDRQPDPGQHVGEHSQFVAECERLKSELPPRSTRRCRSTRRPSTTATPPTRKPPNSSTGDAKQDRLAQLSTNTSHRVVAGASHEMLVGDRTASASTITAIRDVVASVRSGGSLVR